jgi:hypothetical protein
VVELCWGFHQRLIAAYAPDRRRVKTMSTMIDALCSGTPARLEELDRLGRPWGGAATTCWPTSTDHASNWPSKAINGRLEALRRNALDSQTLPTTESAPYCTAATSPYKLSHSDSGEPDMLQPIRSAVVDI